VKEMTFLEMCTKSSANSLVVRMFLLYMRGCALVYLSLVNSPPVQLTCLLLADIQVTDITVSSAVGAVCVYNTASLRRLANERPLNRTLDVLELDPPILNALGAYKAGSLPACASIPVNVAREIVEGALSGETTR
jgi:hypothetical protein